MLKLSISVTLGSLLVASLPVADASAQGLGTVTVAQSQDVTTLNPTQDTQKFQRRVRKHIFDALTAYDVNNNPVPVLAERWEQVNPTTWRFHLRPNVKFTNGEPLTAEAIKATLQANQTAPSRNAGAFGRIFAEARAIDDLTVDLVTKEPYAWVLPMTADTMFIVPPKHYADVGLEGFADNPIGTGAYKLDTWRKGDRVILTANSGFWGGTPKAKEVVFWAVPDNGTRVAALLNGDADVIAGLPPIQAGRVEKSGVAHVVAGPSSAQPVWIGLMTNRAPLDDVRVRRAINYAVNKDALVDKLLRGYGKVMSQACAQGTVCYNTSIDPYSYDPAKAKQLLAEAGATSAEITLQVSPIVAQHREVGLAVAQDLRAVGIKVNVMDEEWSQMAAKLFNRKNNRADAGDAFLIYSAAGPDVEMLQPSLYGSSGIFNWNFYGNDRLDTLLSNAEKELDASKRQALFMEVNQIVHDDAPKLFLYEPLSLWGVSNKYIWQADPGDFFYAEDLKAK